MKKNHLEEIKNPALVFCIVSAIVSLLSGPFELSIFSLLGWLISFGISHGISQALAYGTYFIFVAKKDKGSRATWINYIVWICVANLGMIAELMPT